MLLNQTNNMILAKRVVHAITFWQRLRGLLGTRRLPDENTMIIHKCNSVHTIGMMYRLDVVFADKDMIVLKTISNLPLFRATMPVSGAYYAIELPVGTVAKSHTNIGDRLRISC